MNSFSAINTSIFPTASNAAIYGVEPNANTASSENVEGKNKKETATKAKASSKAKDKNGITKAKEATRNATQLSKTLTFSKQGVEANKQAFQTTIAQQLAQVKNLQVGNSGVAGFAAASKNGFPDAKTVITGTTLGIAESIAEGVEGVKNGAAPKSTQAGESANGWMAKGAGLLKSIPGISAEISKITAQISTMGGIAGLFSGGLGSIAIIVKLANDIAKLFKKIMDTIKDARESVGQAEKEGSISSGEAKKAKSTLDTLEKQALKLQDFSTKLTALCEKVEDARNNPKEGEVFDPATYQAEFDGLFAETALFSNLQGASESLGKLKQDLQPMFEKPAAQDAKKEAEKQGAGSFLNWNNPLMFNPQGQPKGAVQQPQNPPAPVLPNPPAVPTPEAPKDKPKTPSLSFPSAL